MVGFLDSVSWICLVVGPVFCIIGGVGLLRLPDFYTRTHAAGITDTLGAGLIILGLILQAGFTLITVKLVFIIIFMLFINPGATHGLAKAAFAQGVKVDSEGKEPDAAAD
ncbi:MAG: monovalent cation/H(+) antiporter subunit G [Candidatus Marinimicrobia bacterium]|nr:monovalent cation/H(+) antiporter subunit G [Candidatus Neomarinimicrobiota bacterium]